MNRAVSLTITLCVAFFLAFLGMRLPSLQEPVTPKPKPRAVVKTSPKGSLLSTEIKHPKQHHAGLPETAATPPPPPLLGRLTPPAPVLSLPAIAGITRAGRAPPRC